MLRSRVTVDWVEVGLDPKEQEEWKASNSYIKRNQANEPYLELAVCSWHEGYTDDIPNEENFKGLS